MEDKRQKVKVKSLKQTMSNSRHGGNKSRKEYTGKLMPRTTNRKYQEGIVQKYSNK